MPTLNNTRFDCGIRSARVSTTPLTGSVPHNLEAEQVIIPTGNGEGQADQVYRKTVSMAGSGTTSIDFNSWTDNEGTSTASAYITAIGWQLPEDAPGNVQVSPNGTNGWTSLLADASDIITVKPGDEAYFRSSQGYAVSSTNKVLDFINSSATAQTIEVMFLARSA